MQVATIPVDIISSLSVSSGTEEKDMCDVIKNRLKRKDERRSGK